MGALLECISLWSNPAPDLAQKACSADFSPSLGKSEMHPIALWSNPAPDLAQKACSADFSPYLGKNKIHPAYPSPAGQKFRVHCTFAPGQPRRPSHSNGAMGIGATGIGAMGIGL
ncbi:MAG: hypothetical protein VKK80_12370 [Prochlorothrix sp.]|nr:hypothetical protein [Prochlorothrix sp.]